MNRIFEFFKDADGKFSSKRLGMLLIILGFTVEYMVHVFSRTGTAFEPSYVMVGLVVGILGINFGAEYLKKKS